MQSRSIFNSAVMRLLILVSMISIVLTACDALTTPDADEDVAFDGPPEVTIASPLAGDTYQEGVGVNILLRVDNAGPDVARIAIEVDNQIIGEAILPNPNGDPSFTVSNGWPALGAGSHTISAIASRSDGTVSNEATVTINVVAADMPESDTSEDMSETTDDTTTTDDTASDQSTTDPTDTPPLPTPVQQATTVPPTNTPAPPTNTPTPSRPQVTISTGANVRNGPGLVFDPPIGSLAAGATANILAVNNAGTWYKIQYYNGDGWVNASVVTTTGNLASLPREVGPPTPVQATATPVATATPATAPDLSITNVAIGPHPFVCNQASQIQVTISNSGNANSPGGRFIVEDLYNGNAGANTEGTFPELGPGISHTATVFLTVSNNFNEAHVTRITVDPNGQIAESNESNNVRNEAPYVLATGGC